MSFWDGTNWVADGTTSQLAIEPQASNRRRESRVARWAATGVMVIAAALLILPFGAVSAAPSASSVWIESSSGTRLGGNTVHFGDAFWVGYSTRERQPWAHVVCYANASTTYTATYTDGSIWGMYYSVYPGGPSPQAFVAGQSVDGNWASGGADCRVDLLKFSSGYTRSTVLASTEFMVGS